MRDFDIIATEGAADVVLLRSSRQDVATLIRALAARPEVEYAEPNYIYRTTDTPQPQSVPNDPNFDVLYGLNNAGQPIRGTAGVNDADIDAPDAWNYTTGSASVVVGSIDTGVEFDHPDLAANIWTAPTAFTVTVGGVQVTCPEGTHGYNAILNSCGGTDDNSHGSHTSGTMGAVGNNGTGVVGVNWHVKILPCKFLSAGGNGSTIDALQCAEFIRRTRAFFGKAGGQADVVATNNSWGGGGPSISLSNEIREQGEAGILFVASAGNNGRNTDVTPQYPADYPMQNIISVAATDNKDMLASFSNFGVITVDLGAPGVNVFSTTLDASYGYKSGTSMAAPHVTGAVALLKAACPNLTHMQLKNTIMNNVDVIPSLSGKTVTGGRLNIAKAIQSCVPSI
jgi:subtilisin family serine protease